VAGELQPLDAPVVDAEFLVTAVDTLGEAVADALPAGDLLDGFVDEVVVDERGSPDKRWRQSVAI
jgi:hypothetical protein